MLARINTIALEGVSAVAVEVEVDLSRGLPAMNMVGLPEGAVREAKDRVRAALTNSGFSIPSRRVTINLAPAHLPKVGSGYDLPMAMGLLVAMERLPQGVVNDHLFLGELALDGRLKPVSGCLPAAIHARDRGVGTLIVPGLNGPEAALVPEVRVVAPATLLELVRHLLGETTLEPVPTADWQRVLDDAAGSGLPDLADVKGQEHAKRALEVAAAGGHNLIMSGPPGSGKTMLARCLPRILPPMALHEALEVTAIHSVADRLTPERPFVGTRPFRAPHHTSSQVALVGGGGYPRPGEVSLAHRGILFLDEIPEFGRTTLEVLREPLEAGDVTISRAARSTRFPADFQLVAACNPCPCGHRGDPFHACRCTPMRVEQYRARLSGPLLDRIDLHLEVPPVPPETLVSLPGGEPSASVRERVMVARQRQLARNGPGIRNAALEGAALERHVALDDQGRSLLMNAGRRLGFSARAHHRILKVSRTIADLDENAGDGVGVEHLAEAIQFRVGGGFQEK